MSEVHEGCEGRPGPTPALTVSSVPGEAQDRDEEGTEWAHGFTPRGCVLQPTTGSRGLPARCVCPAAQVEPVPSARTLRVREVTGGQAGRMPSKGAEVTRSSCGGCTTETRASCTGHTHFHLDPEGLPVCAHLERQEGCKTLPLRGCTAGASTWEARQRVLEDSQRESQRAPSGGAGPVELARTREQNSLLGHPPTRRLSVALGAIWRWPPEKMTVPCPVTLLLKEHAREPGGEGEALL